MNRPTHPSPLHNTTQPTQTNTSPTPHSNLTPPLTTLLNQIRLLLRRRRRQPGPINIFPKLRISLLILGQNNFIRFSRRRDVKETIHGFEGDGFCLGDEKPDEENAENHHAGEEEEDSAAARAHAVEHLGREAGDDEVLDEGWVSTGGGIDGIKWVGVRNLPKTNY